MKTYKKKYDRELRHIKIILAHERHNMPVNEWLRLVHETKACILDSPDEFFCDELSAPRFFHAAIEKVFDGFLEDQRLLALQTPRSFRIPGKSKERL